MKIGVNGRRVTAGQVLVLGLIAFAPLGASWAATPIYKCFDRKSDVVYTDEPCKDGAVLDVRAGEADPAAVARLERVRDAFDQAAAERIRDMRLMATPIAYAGPWQFGPGGENWRDYSPYDYGPLWGLTGFDTTGFAGRHPPRARPRGEFKSRGFAFAGPNMGGHR